MDEEQGPRATGLAGVRSWFLSQSREGQVALGLVVLGALVALVVVVSGGGQPSELHLSERQAVLRACSNAKPARLLQPVNQDGGTQALGTEPGGLIIDLQAYERDQRAVRRLLHRLGAGDFSEASVQSWVHRDSPNPDAPRVDDFVAETLSFTPPSGYFRTWVRSCSGGVTPHQPKNGVALK